jgi:hypothetical protein
VFLARHEHSVDGPCPAASTLHACTRLAQAGWSQGCRFREMLLPQSAACAVHFLECWRYKWMLHKQGAYSTSCVHCALSVCVCLCVLHVYWRGWGAEPRRVCSAEIAAGRHQPYLTQSKCSPDHTAVAQRQRRSRGPGSVTQRYPDVPCHRFTSCRAGGLYILSD